MATTPPVKPTAAPISLRAQPELTSGLRVGVLLSHGFTSTPSSVKAWAEYLAARGYAVEVPRLPGHGTTWQEMNTTGWNDWFCEVRGAFGKLYSENDVVVAGGLSMGGALVLRLAELYDDQLAGVMVVNPAIARKGFDAKLLPVLKHVIPALKGVGSDIKKAGVVEDSYPHTPLKAAHSMMSAWPTVVRDLPKITKPLLYFRSTVDHVVDELTEPLIRERVSSTDLTFVPLTNSYHVATQDNDAEKIFADSAEFIARVAGVQAETLKRQ